jgi:hypothetical protein
MRSLVSPILILSLAAIGDGQDAKGHRAEQLRAMRAIADSITVEKTAPGARVRLERLPEPVYRFDDPARQYSDGTVWAWGRSGRPVALLTLSRDRSLQEGLRWIAEMTSLEPGPNSISATVPAFGTWKPSGAGVVMQEVPKARAPAEDPSRRLRQMKALVQQIKAYEYFKTNILAARQRYELRALPQPLHRYADETSGLIDGCLFSISYGLNPEVVLLLEARREGPTGPAAWRCGFARIAVAEIHVELDGKEIWSHRGGYSRGPDDTYWTFAKPIEGE